MLSQPFFKQFAGRRPGLAGKTIRFAPELAELAKLDAASVHLQLRTSADGLTEEAAQRRLATEGPNVVDSENAPRWPTRLLSAVRDPLVLLLLVLAGISFATGDVHAGTLMAVMVLLGVSLRFVQESRADAAAEKLKAMIHLTATVVRLGGERELPLREIVPGDVVRLSAGDMVPADVRVVAAKDLFVTQSALTGESLPVEKSEHPDCRGNCSPLDLANLCFLGTSVESGAATALVVATGARTYFGSMAESLVEEEPDTSFDRGVRDFTWLMIRFLVVMVPLVFVMNVLSKHHWREAFFFAVAVAVGLTPAHKQRIVRALQSKGHVVGFTGDGINDAPALHAADVGISVDSAVDIAKASAGVILLEKDLGVLDEAVIEGRKVFVNILKYVRMGASSNFGNMVSVLGASVFLPFLPMAPIQVLTNNLLYDFSQIPIPTDTVGPDQTAKPRPWLMNDILKFVLWIGPISSLFDYTTFLVLLYSFGCWDPQRKALFQTGWFVESLVTQTLVIHVIRTNKIPFVSGRASWQVTLTTLLVIAVAIWLPFSPVAEALGFTPLPATYWPVLAATALCYVALTQAVKTWLFSKMAI